MRYQAQHLFAARQRPELERPDVDRSGNPLSEYGSIETAETASCSHGLCVAHMGPLFYPAFSKFPEVETPQTIRIFKEVPVASLYGRIFVGRTTCYFPLLPEV
jgi:hypothetical protein